MLGNVHFFAALHKTKIGHLDTHLASCGFYITQLKVPTTATPSLEAMTPEHYIRHKMSSLFQRIFRRGHPRLPALSAGQRIYAIGDVHGRLDLLTALCRAIEADDRQRGSNNTTVIFLGDLIDRGQDSAGVLRLTRAWSKTRNVRFIMGNHEEMFLLSFEHAAALSGFLRYGGRETLASYGLASDDFGHIPFEQVQSELAYAVPEEDRAFIANFETSISIGDYFFVHAGVRPNVALDEQEVHDCRWIREPFLSHKGDHGQHVVHGHTISEEVELKSNRIGIDTGAYRSGMLTALCLEGTRKRILQTQEAENGIHIVEQDVDET